MKKTCSNCKFAYCDHRYAYYREGEGGLGCRLRENVIVGAYDYACWSWELDEAAKCENCKHSGDFEADEVSGKCVLRGNIAIKSYDVACGSYEGEDEE